MPPIILAIGAVIVGAMAASLGLGRFIQKRALGVQSDYRHLSIFPPNSQEAVKLLTEAALHASVPFSWATHPAVHMILAKESKGGQVGIPNYTFDPMYRTDRSKWPVVWEAIRNNTWRDLQDSALKGSHAPSSATGLGQLTASNVDRYYPQGRRGIGDPLEEAVGLLAYLKDRWHTPENLASHYNITQEGW